MSHKLRLGPIAVFLAVIAAVVATLAMLTFATSRADAALAERFAAVTAIRYTLEKDGARFLQAADVSLKNGGAQLPEGAQQLENGNWKYYIERDGYALSVVLQTEAADGADSAAGYTVEEWKISKLWQGKDPLEDLWLG